MGTTRKFSRNMDKLSLSSMGKNTRLQKAVSAVTAMGFVLQPVAAMASVITRADGNGAGPNLVNGAKTDIFAEKVVGQVAMNSFQQFQLDAGHIANMYFKEQGGSADAASLVNFVNSRIDINGTVNAIQNSKIGGKLFFLSKEGMAVGAQGVINAGSLYVATPTAKRFEEIVGSYTQGTVDENIENALFTSIPINASGTITVLGKINAVDSVNLRAPKIGIGQNVSGETVYDVEAGGTAAGAAIRTGVTDFSNIVNINGVQSGLNGEALKATQTGSGDIVLSAYNSYNDKYAGVKDDFKFPEETIAAELVVAEGADINAAGKAKLSATAVNNVEVLGDGETKTTSDTNSHLFGQVVDTKAKVKVDGQVTGKQVDISANAYNHYVSSESSSLLKDYGGDTSKILSLVGFNLDAAYGVLGSEATVNVGEKAVITAAAADKAVTDKDGNAATEKALSITANSTVDLAVGATASSTQLLKKDPTKFIPGAGVTYAKSDNKAEVTINGALASAGSTEIAAKADSKLAATATGSAGHALGAASVTVASGSNSSKVTIGKQAKLADGNLKGDVSITAKSTNSVNTKANVGAGDDGLLATAINVTAYDSKAAVDVLGSINSGGSLDIAAENLVTDNVITANNSMGTTDMSNKIKAFKDQYMKESAILDAVTGEKGLVEQLRNWVANWKLTPGFLKKVIEVKPKKDEPEQSKPTTEPTIVDNIKGLFSAGASVGVANESNTANVSIGQGVSLTAAKDLTIKADSTIQDTQMNVTGSSANNADKSQKKAMVNAAVLYAKLENNAAVTVAGGEASDTEATNVQLTGKNVDVQAKAAFEYNRINRMVAEILAACEKVEEAYNRELPHDLSFALADLRTKANAVTAFREAHPKLSFDEFMASEEFKALLASSNALNKLVAENNSAEFSKLKDVAIDSLSVAGVAKKFADATNYLNFNAGSANNGKAPTGTTTGGDAGNGTSTQADASGGAAGSGSGSTTGENQGAAASVAGSVTITGLTNNAKVLIGQNAVINAAEKADLKAASQQTDVALTGKLGLNGGGDAAVGGTVGLGVADANSMVVVAKGARITAGDINLQAKNEISHTNIAAGAGKGAFVGVNGMVSYLTGDSSSIVSVDDEAILTATKAGNNAGKISIKALNDTNVISIAGALSLGDTAGVGAGVAITDFERYNYAAITDNGYAAPADTSTSADDASSNDEDTSSTDNEADTTGGTSTEDNMQDNTAEAADEAVNADRSENADNLTSIADKKLSKLQQLIQDNSGLAENEQEGFFGSQTAADSTGGSITASGLDVSAETTGNIINLTVAGGISTGDDSGEVGIGDKVNAFVTNKTNGVKNIIYSIDNSVAKWLNGLLKRETKAKSVFPTDVQPTAQPTKKYNSFTIAGAGSASVNTLVGDTAAIIDGAKININNTEAAGENVSVKASDSALVVAGSGAAGISWKNLGKNENANSTNVAVAGAVGVNQVDSATLAVIRNSQIDNADAIINDAQKAGAVVAAGIGLGVSKNSQGNNGGTNVAASANASVNLVDNTVYALMQDNNVNQSGEADNKTSLTNSAFDNDIQITGGLSSSISVGGNNAYVGGATVSYGSLKNDIQSAIIGGNYNRISKADVTAKTNMTQVGVAANASVAAGADTSYGFGGALAYNKMDNYANATVENISFSGESLNVAAYDTNDTTNAHQAYIKARGFDADGQGYLEQIKDTVNEQEDNEGNKITPVDNTRKGNIIVTGATTVGVTTGNDGGAAGAAVSISDIDNDFNASIKGSKIITTGSGSGDSLVGTNVAASSNTILAGVAAGVAGTKGSFGVGGSANWQMLNNDVTASIENSTIQAPKTAVNAVSSALAINVAGQLGVTAGSNSKVGAGLALAYNSLNNTTGAYVKGAAISGIADNAAELNVSAANKGSVYSVGAAVGAGTATVTADGAIVVNKGKNDVEAVIDAYDGSEKKTADGRTKLDNMSKVNVKASDESRQLAVVGAVSVAAGSKAKAAVGGTIVINDIGSLAGGKQSNTAAIRNTDITTKNAGKINVNAVDEAKMTTISVGTAITTGNGAFSGAGAAALIEKETKAELIGTNVNKDDNVNNGNVNVNANTNNDIITVGVVAAGAKDAAIGAGIGVNQINADTTANIQGGKYKVNDFQASSEAAANITAIGIGAAAAKTAGIAGNVGVNMINNNTRTKISNGADINASGTIAALAKSADKIKNFGGALGVAAGGQAGIGMGVAYNEISGTTESIISDSTLTAAGNGNGVTVTERNKDDNNTVQATHKGIVVAADATHDLTNIALSGGVAASADVGVGVAGTVTVNRILGATNAEVNSTSMNAGLTDLANVDIYVDANDTTKSESYVGTLAVGVGADGGVGAGVASDTSIVNRNVTAQIDGGSGAAKAVNGHKITVDALNKAKMTTSATGVAAAGGAYGAAAGAGTVSVAKLGAETKARVNNITGTNNGLEIKAEHKNDIHLISAAAAASGAVISGAAGAGIGVVNDDSNTVAELSRSSITANKQNNDNTSGNISVNANNATKVETEVIGVAASLGAAGLNVAVNNLDNTVSTLVNNNTKLTAENKFTAAADNTVTTRFFNGSNAVGGGAAAVGVGVNTIDTGVVTQIANSNITAGTIDVRAKEDLDVRQVVENAALGALGFSANVSVTTIGSKAADQYGDSDATASEKKASFNTKAILEMANNSVQAQENMGSYEEKGEQKSNIAGSAFNGKTLNTSSGASASSGKDTAEGVQAKISGSKLTSTGDVDIKAERNVDANVTSASVAAGFTGVGAASSVAVLDVERKTGVTVDKSTVVGKNITLMSKQGGASQIDAYQVALGISAISAAYAQNSLHGANNITIRNNSTLQATGVADSNEKGKLTVKAEDTSAASVSTIGATAGAVAGGVIVTNATNNSETTIGIDSSNFIAGSSVYEQIYHPNNENNTNNEAYYETTNKVIGYDNIGAVDIAAVKANTISAKTIGGAFGAGAVQGIVARATDSGSSKVHVTGAANFLGDTISLNATNMPAVKAEAQAYTGGLLGAAGTSIAIAKAAGTVENTIGAGSTFAGNTVNITADVTTQTKKDENDNDVAVDNVSAKTIGSTFGSYSGAYNQATAENNMTLNVDVAEATYVGVDKLNINGSNASIISADALGVTIGTAIASGSNRATTTTNLTTTIKAAGATADSSLDAISIGGSNYAHVSNDAKGYGGGLIGINPVAARSENTLTTKADVTVSGTWNNIGSITASANNSDNLKIKADSTTAAVVGASGTEIDNDVTHTANTHVQGTIISDGKQSYNASNTVNHDVDLKGNGYGGASVNANVIDNDLSYNAGVDFDGAKVIGAGDKGSIEALAYTSGKMDYKNVLKSAGVIPITVAVSTNDVNYNNHIDIKNNSTLSTAKLDQNITLAATDETEATFETVADTQGGAIGAASAKTENRLQRTNAINLTSGNLFSTNDVNIYAGANLDGISSSLNYNVIADAYNKTAIPLCTSPKVENTMSQNNQVNISGNIDSVRHVNLKAGKGLTTVVTSAKEYNIYTGESGKGSVASTALGDNSQVKDEAHNNFVNIASGNRVRAGVHNNLTLNISGSTSFEEPTYSNDANGDLEITQLGKINYNIKKDASVGSDWFDVDKNITVSEVDIANGLYSRLMEIDKVIGDYATNSAEYETLKNERKRLITQMEENGFIKTSYENDKTYKEIFSEISLPAVEVNDIVISGGNININADAVTGNGTLLAQGAGDLTINNTSDLYLKINDLVIKDKGGTINYNDKAVSSIKGFSGTLNASNANGAEPKITVSSTGTSNNKKTTADIGIFGTVQNSTGDVLIKNSNYNINVDGNANISARNITLQADQGSVTQNSKGLLLIGGDPVTKYQFSSDISKKIQKYLSGKVIKKETVDWFDNITSWEQYKQVILNHASEIGLSDTEKKIVEDYTVDQSSGIVAGNNIYISGLNVNLDGLVQSGYKAYKVELDNTANTKISNLDREYSFNRKALSDQEVMSNDKYCVTTKAGATYNGKTYDYTIKVYYNPSTGELLTESIEPDGGKIYITGAVSSTGNGRILAMDGTPEITIDTSKVNKNLRVNKITNKDITGLISIKDTQKNMLTEYTTDGTNISKKETSLKKGSTDASTTSTINGSSTQYTPEKNMTVSWTGGTGGDRKVTEWQYKKKFVAWGLIKYGTTKDFIKDQGVAAGKVETSSTSITGEDPLGQGTIIGVNDKLGNKAYTVSTKDYSNASETTYSPVSTNKKYKGTPGKIFGYGECTYTWTETESHSTSSTYTIKADKDIDVGFMTGGTGDISITSQKDMLLNGNISNATKADGSAIGKITLKSNDGAISSVGNARVNADNLTISAATGVDINHGALGKNATIDVKSTTGNVTINSDKGSLTFTGGKNAGAQGGNLKLTAAGDLTTASGTTLNGTRIDFVSGGAINANIASGQTPTSSDTMSASVNAKAQGDITLTNSNGDMRLGVIDSADGNVVLTTSGSFVDAYNDANAGYSDTESKLQSWIDNGLISSSDSDASSSAAADKAYQERIAGLNNRAEMLAKSSDNGHTAQAYKAEADKMAQGGTLLEAKKTYIQAVKEAEGDQDKINAAYTTYQTAQEAYFNQRDTQGVKYSKEERELIIGYLEVGTDKSSYGWSKNQLLYAIQDSILNSKPGQTVDPSTTANVIAKNITLNAKTGGIGIDTAPTEIAYDKLSELDNMKLLAASKAGDLTWDDANNKVIIRRQQPINLELRDKVNGVVTVNGRDNVYISAIKDSTLNFNKVETAGDVKLTADNGINMIGNDGIITGRNLIISSGKGSIGSKDNYIVTKVTGTVDANSGQDIYLEQKDGVLTLLAVAAGKDINIIANKGMKMSGATNDQAGYISSTGGVINLTANEGSIGTTDEKEYIRIENNGAVVNAAAKDGIYIKGKKQNTMVLGTVESKDGTVQLVSEGSVSLGRAAGENQTAVTGVIKAAGNGNINARGDIDLTNGSITVSGENSKFTLQAVGKVEQKETSGGIVTNTLNVKADKSHLLLSRSNNVRNLNARFNENNQQLIDGVLRFNGINEELNVSLVDDTKAVEGDVEIKNLHENGKVNIITSINAVGNGTDEHQGSIDVVAKSDITTKAGIELKAKKDITMTTENGSITTNGTLNADNNIKLTANNGKIATGGTVTAGEGNVSYDAKSDITATGNIEATKGSATINSSGASVSTKDVTAGTNIDIDAGTSVSTKNVTAGTDVDINAGASVTTKDVTAGSNVDIDAGASVSTDNVSAGNNINVDAKQDITNNGKLEAKDVALDAGANITTKSTVTAKAGNVDMKAGSGNIEAAGAISAAKDTLVNAGASITAKDIVTAGNNTKLAAGAAIITEGNVKATTGNVSYDAKSGITANGSVSAGTDVSMSNQDNDITTGANAEINAGNDVTLKNNNGSITAGSTVSAGNNASFNVDENGNVTTNGDVTANKDITYDAKGSITTGGSINSTLGNINLTTDAAKGDMTFGGNVKTANGNIGITAKGNGNLQFNGNVITDNGNLDIIVEGDGNVNDDDKLFSATCKEHDKDDNAGNITDPKAGNVTLQVKGVGEVDLNEIYATHDARVDVANGNLKLAKIDGNLVAVQLRTEGKTMDLKDIIAGTKIVAKGSNMDLDKIKQREGADGMLNIVPDGAKDDAPIDNLSIGEIATNTGVRFEHLWLNTGNIHVSEGKLHIDKLVVNDNAHFSNAHMTTAVWGNPPQRDDSDSVYWNNTAVNNPKDEFSKASNELNDWIKSGTNAEKWMFLHFTEIPNIQQSNGALLGLRNYDYVYNQRFTAVDKLNRVHADDPLKYYDISTEPQVVMYFRYNLYDLDEQQKNAAADKVVVDA